MLIPYLPLWSLYLDHVRRHNNVSTAGSEQARHIIHQAFELALRQAGLDKDSGRLWQDYIGFIKSGPGIIGGSNWQDQQKMDLLRKTYQQAICVPTQATNALWKEYDAFEMGLNKMTVGSLTHPHSSMLTQAGSKILARPVSCLYVGTKLIHRTAEYHPRFKTYDAALAPPCSRFRWRCRVHASAEYLEALDSMGER